MASSLLSQAGEQVSLLLAVGKIEKLIPEGIGLMMAKALASNGAAKVYIVGRREEKLKQAAATHPK